MAAEEAERFLMRSGLNQTVRPVKQLWTGRAVVRAMYVCRLALKDA